MPPSASRCSPATARSASRCRCWPTRPTAPGRCSPAWPLHSLIPGGFTAADFTVDEAAGTVTCPAGHAVTFTSGKRVARFADRCTACPLSARCTTSARGRSVLVAEHDALQRDHRARVADPDFQAAYRRHRPMVERSIAWLARGNRRVPYRGVAKNDAWLHLRAAAINLRRLLTLGLTGIDGRGRWPLDRLRPSASRERGQGDLSVAPPGADLTAALTAARRPAPYSAGS